MRSWTPYSAKTASAIHASDRYDGIERSAASHVFTFCGNIGDFGVICRRIRRSIRYRNNYDTDLYE